MQMNPPPSDSYQMYHTNTVCLWHSYQHQNRFSTLRLIHRHNILCKRDKKKHTTATLAMLLVEISLHQGIFAHALQQ